MKLSTNPDTAFAQWLNSANASKRNGDDHLVYCEVDDDDAERWAIQFQAGQSRSGGGTFSAEAEFDTKRELYHAISLMRYAFALGRKSAQEEIKQVLGITKQR